MRKQRDALRGPASGSTSGSPSAHPLRAPLAAALLLGVALATPGCYLAHLAAGQARLLHARQPIDALLSDPATPAELRRRLELVREARAFAAALGLEVGGQYTSYAAWPGDRVVTSVVATRPGEIEPAGFWFPIVGRVPYKGFFDPERAAAEAARLRERGFDVCQVPVAAYSTLGWLDDPVTGPMLRRAEGEIVETIVHELVHATVYVPDHAAFNEGTATFVGQEARVRFYAGDADPEAAERERQQVEDARLIARAIESLRERIRQLYAELPEGGPRADERARVEREARAAVAALPLASLDAAAVAEGLRLNDACLALQGTYSADLAGYAAVLARVDGDLAAFVDRLRAAAEAPDPRAALLE